MIDRELTPEEIEEERDFYKEALVILDKIYPDLKIESFRWSELELEKIAEVRHLKAVYDRLKAVLIREEKDNAIQEAERSKLEAMAKELQAQAEMIGRMREALIRIATQEFSKWAIPNATLSARQTDCAREALKSLRDSERKE